MIVSFTLNTLGKAAEPIKTALKSLGTSCHAAGRAAEQPFQDASLSQRVSEPRHNQVNETL